MYKKTFVALGIAGILVFSGATFARPAQALTADELQNQVKVLLAKIAELTSQLNVLQSSTTVSTSTTVSPNMPVRICTTLNRNLSQGTKGDDVVGLQEFLRDQGYLSATATGYFGPMTAQAVAKWQSSQGVSSVGSIGPMSRERIKVWCGNNGKLSARPTAGAAPLTVNFSADVQLTNPAMVADAGDYKIVFGDGSEQILSCTSTTGSCSGPHAASHAYTSSGSYTATLVHFGYFGLAASDGGAPSQTVGKVLIQVGTQNTSGDFSANPTSGPAPLNVQFTYRPPTDESAKYYIDFGDGNTQIMDIQQIYCIRAPCISPSVASHAYAQNGTYTATVTRYIACMFSNPRCMIATMPLGQVQITVGPTTTGNQPPTISSFSGPTTLSINQTGAWSIQASDPENQALSYHITWGDEYISPMASANAGAASDAFVQTTTFTHVYSSAGTYTVSVVVRDSAGQEAKTSTTVQIGNGNTVCTAQYQPVCGRPKGCMNTCPPGMYCTMMCQLYPVQTYSNRCALDGANADYLYDGVCNSNVY